VTGAAQNGPHGSLIFLTGAAQNGPHGSLIFLFSGYWSLFPQRYSGHSMKLNAYRPTSAKVGNEWSCAFILLLYLHGMHRDNLTFAFTCIDEWSLSSRQINQVCVCWPIDLNQPYHSHHVHKMEWSDCIRTNTQSVLNNFSYMTPMVIVLCKLLGFCSIVGELVLLQTYDATALGNWFVMFWGNAVISKHQGPIAQWWNVVFQKNRYLIVDLLHNTHQP